MNDIQLVQGDCLVEMQGIPDKSIDMVLCDLPYGTTACKWDVVIPIEPLWEQYERVLTDRGTVLLFGSEPFSTRVKVSNINRFKYDLVWKKQCPTGFQHAKNMPLKNFELISVFSKASIGHRTVIGDKRMTYNPQGIVRVDRVRKASANQWGNIAGKRSSHKAEFITEYTGYPSMILEYGKDKAQYHPTQKPVALLEYLIKTYSNEGDTILDNTMGSGSTMVACVNTKRKGIGIELNEEYFAIAEKRVKEAQQQLTFDF